jgi:hypothetical protein
MEELSKKVESVDAIKPTKKNRLGLKLVLVGAVGLVSFVSYIHNTPYHKLSYGLQDFKYVVENIIKIPDNIKKGRDMRDYEY